MRIVLTCRAALASSPVSGSSRMMRRGACTSAPGERHLLAHALGKPAAALVRVRAETELVQQGGGRGRGLAWLDLPQPGDEFQVLDRRQPVVDQGLVRHPGCDLLSRHRVFARVDAEDGDVAGIRPEQARRPCAGSSSCPRRWAPSSA